MTQGRGGESLVENVLPRSLLLHGAVVLLDSVHQGLVLGRSQS